MLKFHGRAIREDFYKGLFGGDDSEKILRDSDLGLYPPLFIDDIRDMNGRVQEDSTPLFLPCLFFPVSLHVWSKSMVEIKNQCDLLLYF